MRMHSAISSLNSGKPGIRGAIFQETGNQVCLFSGKDTSGLLVPLVALVPPPPEVGDAGDVVGGEDDVGDGGVRAQLVLRRERDHLLYLKTENRKG